MNAINNTARDTIITLGNELTTSSGIRAVSAWLALCEPDVTYSLDDEDAPNELRANVSGDVGYAAACEGLDPHGDVPRYLDYMSLRNAYGTEWPVRALSEYLETMQGAEREDAEESAVVIWRTAIERYEEQRELVQKKEKAMAEAMTKCLQELLQKLAA